MCVDGIHIEPHLLPLCFCAVLAIRLSENAQGASAMIYAKKNMSGQQQARDGAGIQAVQRHTTPYSWHISGSLLEPFYPRLDIHAGTRMDDTTHMHDTQMHG
jgi:hypothetical protein